MCTIWIFEDNVSTQNTIIKPQNLAAMKKIAEKSWEIELVMDYYKALARIPHIKDSDIISLDSQMDTEDSQMDTEDLAGQKILARVRQRECKCLAVWHSRIAPVPLWAQKDCKKCVPWSHYKDLERIYKEWIKKPTIATPPPELLHPPFPEYLVTARLLQIAKGKNVDVETALKSQIDGFDERVKDEFKALAEFHSYNKEYDNESEPAGIFQYVSAQLSTRRR